MAFSRNAREYLERKGLLRSHAMPAPRLHVDGLKVHGLPLSKPLPQQGVLEQYEGEEPPDRGIAKPWPNQVEPYGEDRDT